MGAPWIVGGALALLVACAVALWVWWRWVPVRYVALGDSLAAGVGSLLFLGYPPRLAASLAARLRRPVALRNLGRFGWAAADLLQALRQDPAFREAVAAADLVTVGVGGNDLRRCGTDPACLERAVAAFRRDWEAIWAEVRRLNPRALCAAVNLYNPYPPGHPLRPWAETWVPALNAAIADPAVLAAYGVVGVADAYGRFQGRECQYTWMCRLGDVHPTDRGYAALAAALMAVLAPALPVPGGPPAGFRRGGRGPRGAFPARRLGLAGLRGARWFWPAARAR